MKLAIDAFDTIMADQQRRWSHIIRDGEQLRRERINSTRGSEHANNVPDSNQ